jgi:nicotinate dehydrogenase FAD-subunit
MERFGYVRAESIPHALTLLAEPGIRSRPLAGGTDLLVALQHEPRLCDRVVDISRIAALHEIGREDGRVAIGAAATFAEVMSHPLVVATAPVLVEACRQVGAVQIRNMGTVGGNVANAAACADSLPALVCLDAVAHVATMAGPVAWPVWDLVTGPNRTRIPPGALLTSLSYSVPHPDCRSAFLKLGRRNALAISRLTVAAMGRMDALGRVAECRLAPGAASPQVHRLARVEQLVTGRSPSDELWREAGQAAAEEMVRVTGRRWSTEYKEQALAAMVAQALAGVYTPEPAVREAV